MRNSPCSISRICMLAPLMITIVWRGLEPFNQSTPVAPTVGSTATSNCILFYNTTEVCTPLNRNKLYDEYEVSVDTCTPTSHWHLSYISRRRPDNQYSYNRTWQVNTTVYILDTWVDIEHSEFEGRIKRSPAFNSGEHPHGTHVAGLIGGKRFGVNRKALMVSVQVLNSQGRGMWSEILRGLKWISTQRPPSIINMSISGTYSAEVNTILALMTTKGWKIVASSGNNGQNRCLTATPASSPAVVVVGAMTREYQRADFSNYGKCVALLAPGQDIISAYPGDREAIMSGTSMAAPLVSGFWSTRLHWSRGTLLRLTTNKSTYLFWSVVC